MFICLPICTHFSIYMSLGLPDALSHVRAIFSGQRCKFAEFQLITTNLNILGIIFFYMLCKMIYASTNVCTNVIAIFFCHMCFVRGRVHNNFHKRHKYTIRPEVCGHLTNTPT